MAAEASQRCLYEILGVERSSSLDEIRAAYKKLALKLHPDKNKDKGGEDDTATATARFQELQRAYEVLSDPRERSWYDSHRSQILFSSSQSSSNAKFPDFDINLWPYFTTCVYSGHGDSGKGFFRVYGDLFEKLFQQEIAFTHAMGAGAVTVAEAPLIGNLESPYAQVSAFYKYWLGFCTVKDFSWVDEYRASAGPNRKLRRLMEEENKKLRKKAKREYNEAVRELAEFVKKRDKRVLERQAQKKRENNEKLVLANLRRKQLEKERLDKAVRYQEQDWTIAVEDDDYADAEYWGDVKKASDNQEFYCIVCSKKFKSDKQWKNHEQSKKHKDRLGELRDSFAEEDMLADVTGIGVEVDAFGLDIGFDHQTEKEFNAKAQVDDLLIKMDRVEVRIPELGDSEEDDKSNENKADRGFSALNKTDEHKHFGSTAYNGDLHDGSDKSSYHSFVDERNTNAEINSSDERQTDNNETDDEDCVLEAMLKTHMNKQKSNKALWNAAQTENHDSNHIYNGNAEEALSGKPTGFEPKSSNLAQRDTDDGTETVMGGSLRPDQQQGSKKSSKEEKKQATPSTKHHMTGIADGMESGSENKGGAQQSELISNFHADRLEGDKEECPKSSAKNYIEQKSATSGTLANNASSKGKKGKGVAKFPGNTCDTCGKDFDSRNQLFIHLNGSGHAMLKGR